MEVNFKGIENIKVYKKEKAQKGYYLDEEKIPHPVTEDLKCILINCKLTDDNNGNDLQKYKDAAKTVLQKTGLDYYEDSEDENIQIQLNKRDLIFEEETQKFNTLLVNGRQLYLNQDSILPIYSFLNKLTTKILNQNNLTETQKQYVDIVDRAITEEAYNYLDIKI